MTPAEAEIIADAIITREILRMFQAVQPQFPEVYCSSCGEGFGPGKEGFSDCEQHASKEQTT